MRIKLSEMYRGKITDGQLLTVGVHEVDERVGRYLLGTFPNICYLAGANEPVVHKTVEESETLPEMKESISFNPEAALEDSAKQEESGIMGTKRQVPIAQKEVDPQFVCCGKDYGNQGSLNLHRKNKKCPLHKK